MRTHTLLNPIAHLEYSAIIVLRSYGIGIDLIYYSLDSHPYSQVRKYLNDAFYNEDSGITIFGVGDTSLA